MEALFQPYVASLSQWWSSVQLLAMEGDSPVLHFIGYWGYRIYEEREMLQMQLHVLLAALFPIYTGSHASLRCPPSASDPRKKRGAAATPTESDDDELDEIEAENTVEGLTPSDAIMFPVFASLMLGGLYALIKWLNDPALLNKILGYYFSLIGIFGVGKLAGDALNVWTTVLFPSVWSSGGEVYYVDPLLSQQFTNGPTVKGANKATIHRKFTEKTSPLPGLLSKLKLSEKLSQQLWAIRGLFTNHWIFRGYIHGLMRTKSRVRLNDVIGLLIGISAIVLYNTTGKVWWLANLMGFGFCYGTLQLMSPTTFWTGSLVLAGLFVYDIVMVFYTPLMVTVATTLDVPIKLVFPGPKRGGMLGLGDIVLPGIMMALALRFDLYLYYQRKPSPPESSYSLTPLAQPKPTYESATGHWGERFWTRSLKKADLPEAVKGAVFPKVYFYTSVMGYVLGMLTTLVVLNVFNHAQPALLYLVPGVLGSLWGTALVRGELKLMWEYTEASAEGLDNGKRDNDKLVNKDPMKKKSTDSTVSGFVKATASLNAQDTADGKNKAEKSVNTNDDKEEKEDSQEREDEDMHELEAKEPKLLSLNNEHAHHVFLFSLSAPRRGIKKGKGGFGVVA